MGDKKPGVWGLASVPPFSSNMTWKDLLKVFVPQFPHLRNRRWGGGGQDAGEGMQSQKTEWIKILVLLLSTCVSELQFHHL